MELEQLKEKLLKIHGDLSALSTEKRMCESAIANLACPFNVGDKVIDKNGNKAEVHSIFYSFGSDLYGFKIRKTKNNGGLYITENTAYFYEEWALNEEKE